MMSRQKMSQLLSRLQALGEHALQGANKCDQRLDLGPNQIGQTILLTTPESSRWSDVLCGLVAGTTRG
jgi:hypothetical protein